MLHIRIFSAYLLLLSNVVIAQTSSEKAQKVIEKFILALGGKEKILAIQDLSIEMEGWIDGKSLTISKRLKAPNKEFTEIRLGDNLLEMTVFDGVNVSITVEGQKMMPDESVKQEIAIESAIVPELIYEANNVKINYIGTENIEGEVCEVIEVSYPTGRKKKEYFSQHSGLKIRSIEKEISPKGEEILMVYDFKDYRAVNGVKFPYAILIPIGRPQRIVAYINSIKINTGIKDKFFTIQ